MKNICYIISGIDKALAFEWIIEKLDTNKYKLFFVLLHDKKGGLEDYLITNGIPHVRIHYQNKKNLPNTAFKIRTFLKQNNIEIVHSHLLDAGLAGMIAAWIAGIKTRIYTRHYSNYHHVYFPKGIWYDKIINLLSTKIVAVSKVVQQILIQKENADPGKVTVLYHGFPLSDFDKVTETKIFKLKEKYGISSKRPIIGIVSRYTEWKGIQYTIPAFEKILMEYPEAHLVLANAKGAYLDEIKKLLLSLPAGSYTEVPFENDLFTLFKSFDIFVHVPIDSQSEAFGQVYIEAMAAALPCVFTISGIAAEVASDENALIVPYKNSNAIEKAILKVLESPETGSKLGTKAAARVLNSFQLNVMISGLEKIYG